MMVARASLFMLACMLPTALRSCSGVSAASRSATNLRHIWVLKSGNRMQKIESYNVGIPSWRKIAARPAILSVAGARRERHRFAAANLAANDAGRAVLAQRPGRGVHAQHRPRAAVGPAIGRGCSSSRSTHNVCEVSVKMVDNQ